MAEKKDEIGGFTLSSLINEINPGLPGSKPVDTIVDPEDIIDPIEPIDPVDPVLEPDPVIDPEDIIDPVDPEPVDPVVDPVDPVDPVDTEEFEGMEAEMTMFLRDKLGEELNLEFEEEDKFESMKDLVGYMRGIVEESSKPVYSNDEVRKLDDFIRDGGSLNDYYKIANPGDVNLDTIDIDKEGNQKVIIKEHLIAKGYSNDRAEKVVNRYEDAGVLADEAEDALELLKEYKSKNTEKLLETQEKKATAYREEQQNFYSNVQDSIKDLEEVRGIKVTSKDKQELLNYIFKPSADGSTEYQRDYASDVRNLIESAYFTKKGDALIAKAKQNATSNAYKELHQKLKASKGKRAKASGGQDLSGGSDIKLHSLGKYINT
ncbi:MAG: hypothetical protein ACTSQF_01890 [Candidatus Heimdallarchaeaceae archaeon]